MATKQFTYSGFSYDEDVIEIPIISFLVKKLHLLLPSMFAPVILKHQVILFLVSLVLYLFVGVVQCFAKIEDIDFLQEVDVKGNLDKKRKIELENHRENNHKYESLQKSKEEEKNEVKGSNSE
jgi:hypothetical protein